MTITDTTVSDLRRQLVSEHYRLLDVAHTYRSNLMTGIWLTEGDRQNYVSSSAAANLAYTLAAVLGEIGRAFGDVVGEEFAQRAQTILTDGDHDDLNADVTDEAITS